MIEGMINLMNQNPLIYFFFTAIFLFGLFCACTPYYLTPTHKRDKANEIAKTRKYGYFYMGFAVVVLLICAYLSVKLV